MAWIGGLTKREQFFEIRSAGASYLVTLFFPISFSLSTILSLSPFTAVQVTMAMCGCESERKEREREIFFSDCMCICEDSAFHSDSAMECFLFDHHCRLFLCVFHTIVPVSAPSLFGFVCVCAPVHHHCISYSLYHPSLTIVLLGELIQSFCVCVWLLLQLTIYIYVCILCTFCFAKCIWRTTKILLRAELFWHRERYDERLKKERVGKGGWGGWNQTYLLIRYPAK